MHGETVKKKKYFTSFGHNNYLFVSHRFPWSDTLPEMSLKYDTHFLSIAGNVRKLQVHGKDINYRRNYNIWTCYLFWK